MIQVGVGLVGDLEVAQASRDGVVLVVNVDGVLAAAMPDEPAAQQFPIDVRRLVGVRGVDGHDAASLMNEVPEFLFLLGIADRAAGAVEQDQVVLTDVLGFQIVTAFGGREREVAGAFQHLAQQGNERLFRRGLR